MQTPQGVSGMKGQASKEASVPHVLPPPSDDDIATWTSGEQRSSRADVSEREQQDLHCR